MTDPATWFAFECCTDVQATKKFYGDLLGLPQIWDEEDSLAFRHDCVQLSFMQGTPRRATERWAFQPGWSYGQLPEAPPTQKVGSLALAMEPGNFLKAVDRLQAAAVESLRPEPFWVGYWSFVVKDPDGTTVEISDPHSPGPRGEQG